MKEIPLGGKKAAGRVALVDDGDYELAMQYRWNIQEREPKAEGHRKTSYATAAISGNGSTRQLRMHNLIMGRLYIDHIDHDGLNNRRSNLRPATHGQNMQNARSHQGVTSQYKGVSWERRAGKWRAQIKIDGRFRYLGLFAEERDAALAYNTAALEGFGEYACLNQVPPRWWPPLITSGVTMTFPRAETPLGAITSSVRFAFALQEVDAGGPFTHDLALDLLKEIAA